MPLRSKKTKGALADTSLSSELTAIMKTPSVLLAVLVTLVWSLAGCGKQAEAPQPFPPSSLADSPSGTFLSAVPNPVPAGEGTGKTMINWRLNDGAVGEVYLVTEGSPETLFARGANGPAEAPWITAGSTYEFRLYGGTDHKALLGKVTVTRAKN